MWRLFTVALAVAVAGCSGPGGATSDRPYYPYATNSQGNLEYWWSTFATRQDCLFSLDLELAKDPSGKYYRKPAGCFLTSNDYWQVWWDSMTNGQGDVECVARDISAYAAEQRLVYTVRLRGSPRKGDNWYCT